MIAGSALTAQFHSSEISLPMSYDQTSKFISATKAARNNCGESLKSKEARAIYFALASRPLCDASL
jgi:hypothetical protein